MCKGKNSKISWTQVETGSAITWKYPSCILKGDNSIGEFYSIAITNNHQKADTGTKMIHLGKNTINRFGPVREVKKELVLEIAFDSINESKRHKSGLALRFPRIHRIRWDKPIKETDTLDEIFLNFNIK